MKRLTNARNRCVFCKAADEECAFAAGEFSAPCPDYKTYQRLSAIEDILGDDYDLERLKELVQADREGQYENFLLKPGDKVWAVERDKYGDAFDFCCCVFVGKVGNYVIASQFVNGCGEIEDVLEYLSHETVSDYECGMLVYPADDCYMNKQEAEAALEKMKEGK